MIAAGFLVLVVVAVLVFQHFNWKAQPWPAKGLKPPKYQGHRGYWKGGIQENTLESFKAAKERGLAMVELDVRLAKDQVVVVFHDNTLERLGKNPKNMEEFTSEELFTMFHIPSLQQVLSDKNLPQYINIELKTDKFRDDTLERKVAEVVRATHTSERILFSSFNPLAVRRLSKLLPDVPRALLATKESDALNKFYLKHLWFAPYIHANLLHLDYRFVTDRDLTRFIKRGVPVAFWTVNDPVKAKQLLEQGATSIISDELF